MEAITTKTLPPTMHRSGRVTATRTDCDTQTCIYDHRESPAENSCTAARIFALTNRLSGLWVSGELDGDTLFVCAGRSRPGATFGKENRHWFYID